MGRSQQCTLMLRNVPNRYNKQELIQDLSILGFKNGRDIGYVHLPLDVKTGANRGYAFVAMKTSEAAERFYSLQGERLPRYHTKKIMEVSDGSVHSKKLAEKDEKEESCPEWTGNWDLPFHADEKEMIAPRTRLFSISTASTCSHQSLDQYERDSDVSEAATPITTYMIRNVRNRYSQDDVLSMLKDIGILPEVHFDFFYVPMNPKTGGNFGYGFINFTSLAASINFMYVDVIPAFFQEKVAFVKDSMSPASVQGYEATVKSYQHLKSSRGDRARPQFWREEQEGHSRMEETSLVDPTIEREDVEDDVMRQLVLEMVAHLDSSFEDANIDSAEMSAMEGPGFSPMKIHTNATFFSGET